VPVSGMAAEEAVGRISEELLFFFTVIVFILEWGFNPWHGARSWDTLSANCSLLALCYWHKILDWNCQFFRILAPTTYIFFASAIPVISFGEQLERSTGNGGAKFYVFVLCVCEFEFSLVLVSDFQCFFFNKTSSVFEWVSREAYLGSLIAVLQMESSRPCRHWHPLPCVA
jgi:hypothetical protein